jgi:hypothetical protein
LVNFFVRAKYLKANHFRVHTNSARLIMTSGEQRRSLDEFEDDFDPDLDISKGRDKVWLVKLPKWLMEHWSKTDQDNVELASINIPYSNLNNKNFANITGQTLASVAR